MSATIYCLCNQKGGCAKTVSSISIGIGLAREGRRVLMVDMDSRGSMTASLGYQQPDQMETTLSDTLGGINSYELIAGHRRKHASKLAGKVTMPVTVRELDDDEAVLFMVDSNIQRENLFPSEKAWVYRMKLDALKHQGLKDTSRQVGEKYSVDALSENSNDSARNLHRFIRLTELLLELLQMVDDKKLAFNPAVELSYLTREEQGIDGTGHGIRDRFQVENVTVTLAPADHDWQNESPKHHTRDLRGRTFVDFCWTRLMAASGHIGLDGVERMAVFTYFLRFVFSCIVEEIFYNISGKFHNNSLARRIHVHKRFP